MHLRRYSEGGEGGGGSQERVGDSTLKTAQRPGVCLGRGVRSEGTQAKCDHVRFFLSLSQAMTFVINSPAIPHFLPTYRQGIRPPRMTYTTSLRGGGETKSDWVPLFHVVRSPLVLLPYSKSTLSFSLRPVPGTALALTSFQPRPL